MADRGHLSRFVTTRPVAILMVFLAAVVFGYLSYFRLPVALLPELTYPTITVRTEYPGAAPEEVENDVSRPIEEALGVVSGLERLSSVSRADASDVILELSWDTEVSDATQDILERLDLVILPEEARRPLILHYDPALDPVMELSLSAGVQQAAGVAELKRLRRLADLRIKRALEPIKGVAAVRVRGGLEEEIHVLLAEDQLRRTGLSIRQVIDRLADENINVAGGTIKEGRTEYMVRTLNEYEDLAQIRNTVVAMDQGREIRIRDLGEVKSTYKEREILTRTNGGESVQIEILKEADANIVDLARRVKEVIGSLDRDAAPEAMGSGLAAAVYRDEGAVLDVVADRSLFIESSINEVRTTAILGGLLAVVVLFLFLKDFKSTTIIALSIPISLLVTFAPLNLLGVSLNIMSLGGLALGIGMLVDSSIVVLESVHRCREEGDGLGDAAARGTSEVRGAVMASTLTSIAVFFPMVFVEGVAGQAFGDLGMAVVVSLLAAAAVALFFIPMLASRPGIVLSAPGGVTAGSLLRVAAWEALVRSWRGSRWWARCLLAPYWLVRLAVGLLLELVGKLILVLFMLVAGLVSRVLAPVFRILFAVIIWLPVRLTDAALGLLNRVYPGTLRWALERPVPVLAVVVLSLVGTWQVVRSLDSELLPEVHQGEFTVEAALPVGTPLEATETILAPVEQAILAERSHIRSLILVLGFDSATADRADEGEHTARFKVLLEPSREPAATEAAVADRIRRRLAAIPDLDARIVRPVLFSSRTPIEVEIHGDDLLRLRALAGEAEAVLDGLPSLSDVQSTLRPGAPEVQILYQRDRLARYGLNIGDVASRVKEKVKGYEATRFNLKDRRIPILVRLEMADRETVEDVRNLQVNPGGSPAIPLSSVAEVTLGEGPSEVRRVDGRRVTLIRAGLGDASLSTAIADIRRELTAAMDWPADMPFYISGQNEEWERSRTSLWLALGLSIFLVYVIMAAQFESLMQPFVIMLTIPLAFIGTVLALKVLGLNLSVVVFLGMIMLAGIVVNNAIVLVDYVNTLRGRGLPRDAAVITAGRVRLRPILMTTATTVLGLLPMALGLGDAAEIRTPMAIAVISGLLSSTALTLLVIPTLYVALDRLAGRLRGEAPGPVSHTAPLAGGTAGAVTT